MEKLVWIVLRNGKYPRTYLGSVITIFVVVLGVMSAVLSQQQIVINSDFQDGLLG
jgi:hypothetical protein